MHVGNAVREQIHVGSCKARKPDEGYEDENTDDDVQAGLGFVFRYSMSDFHHRLLRYRYADTTCS